MAVSRPRRRAPVRSRMSAAAWHTRSLAVEASALGVCQIWETPDRPSRWGAHRCSGYSPPLFQGGGFAVRRRPGVVADVVHQVQHGTCPEFIQHPMVIAAVHAVLQVSLELRRDGSPAQHARDVVKQEPSLLRTREEYLPSKGASVRAWRGCGAALQDLHAQPALDEFFQRRDQKSLNFFPRLFHGDVPGRTSVRAEAHAAQPGVLGETVQEAQEQFFAFGAVFPFRSRRLLCLESHGMQDGVKLFQGERGRQFFRREAQRDDRVSPCSGVRFRPGKVRGRC